MRALLLLAFMVVVALPARAADVARFRNLGFSPDGRYFAFIEYGVQDGSGFPYANAFVIDLDHDKWAGSPVRVVTRREAHHAWEARGEALARIEPLMRQSEIDELLNGRVLFHAPPWEGLEPAIRARFVLWRHQLGDPRHTYDLRLSTFPLPGGDCLPGTVASARGFALDVMAMDSGNGLRLYADKKVPASRHCVISYAIDRVIHFRPAKGKPRTVVVVRYGYFGFEGLDERYLAVPVQLPELGGK